MSCYILLEIRPLPLPSPKKKVIELRVEEDIFKIIRH